MVMVLVGLQGERDYTRHRDHGNATPGVPPRAQKRIRKMKQSRLYPCCHAALVERARRRREGAQKLRLLSGLIGASLGAKNLGSPIG